MITLKIIFRKLWRDRFFTFLKVLGLAIGIATCLVVFKIVYYEFSFDKDIPDRENIYQVVQRSVHNGKESGFGGVQSVLADYVLHNFSDIEQTVPLNNTYFPFVSITRKDGSVYRKEDPRVYQTNSAYFEILPYHWLAGNKKDALTQPYKVVLTETKAQEYFGKMSPDEMLGKTVQYDQQLYMVSGVVKDLDFPSSFEANEFLSIPPAQSVEDWSWVSFNSNYNLFVQLSPGQKEGFLNQLDRKFEEMSKSFNLEMELHYQLLPLSEKHFAREYGAFAYTANKNVLWGLMGIGLFILLLAAINYINLSTAQIPYRTKEIGVRKTLGERSGLLTRRFLYETLIVGCLATVLAFPMISGFEIAFRDFLPPRMEDFSFLFPILVFIVGLLICLTFITGLYPAYLINKINVAQVLKIQGGGKMSFGNLNLKKGLIVFQFVIAQVFVIGAYIMASQINFMINTDLGFDKDAVVTIDLPVKAYQNAAVDPFVFKDALQKHSEIREVALGHTPMNYNIWGNSLYRQTDDGELELNMNFKYVDEDYIDFYGIEVLAGRLPEARDTIGSIFLNEAACARLEFKTNEEAIGQTVRQYGRENVTIVGVVNDFYQANLHMAKEPLALVVSHKKDMLEGFNIKLPEKPAAWQNSLAVLEKEWKNYYPDAPFDYEFYDSEIKDLYETDLQQSKMINLATIITIVLGCLGLIGLVTLTAYQRTKEIGIRKVLGSSISDVIVLLSKDYLKLIGWAILISIPIAWWAMNKWLDNFAYRIEIEWWMFLVTGLATVLIALLTVSYRAVKSALANPVESLRDE